MTPPLEIGRMAGPFVILPPGFKAWDIRHAECLHPPPNTDIDAPGFRAGGIEQCDYCKTQRFTSGNCVNCGAPAPVRKKIKYL